MNTLSKGFFRRALSALLATIMVFSLGVVGITSISAAETELAETGGQYNINWLGKVYFVAPSKWDIETYHTIQVNITRTTNVEDTNHQEYIGTMQRVGSSRLYYLNISADHSSWNQNEYICFTANSYAYGSGNFKISGNHYYTTPLDYGCNNSSNYYLFTPYDAAQDAMANGSAMKGDYSSVQDFMKVKQTVNITTNGTSSSAGGSVKMEGQYLSGNNSFGSSTVTSSGASASYDAAQGSTMKLTATNKTGYKFVGWYSGSSLLSSNATYEYSVLYAKTITAKFESTFSFSVNATALESEVFAGTDIEITSSTNAPAGTTVTYTLKDSAGNQVDTSNTTGDFFVDTTDFAEGNYTYTVTASATVSGASYSVTSDPITVKVNRFENLIITPVSIPSSVECGTPINLVVKANTSVEVNYVLKDNEGNIIAENTTGVFSQATTVDDKDTTKVFSIEASAVVNSIPYSATPITVNVEVKPISNTTEINIYFKSTSTKGFKPVASVTGMYQSFERVPMEKAFYICSNETGTADYWWYKSTVRVSDALPTVSFTVVSGRYDMEDTITFTVVDGVTDYYFAIDNLYYDIETGDHPSNLINVTDWEPVERNYCVNAVHMVYDENYDTEEELQYFATKCVMGLNGDVNGDDALNVKDATQVQKSLANLAELGSVGDKVSDFDDDGAATIKDATAIQKAVAGL